jgi:hypothetical protein
MHAVATPKRHRLLVFRGEGLLGRAGRLGLFSFGDISIVCYQELTGCASWIAAPEFYAILLQTGQAKGGAKLSICDNHSLRRHGSSSACAAVERNKFFRR